MLGNGSDLGSGPGCPRLFFFYLFFSKNCASEGSAVDGFELVSPFLRMCFCCSTGTHIKVDRRKLLIGPRR